MIQRVQSIFLILAAITALLVMFFPLASFDASFFPELAKEGTEEVTVYARHYLPVMVTAFLAVSISLFAIFLFRNRPLQIKVSWAALVMMALLIAFFLYFSLEALASYRFQAGSAYPVLGILFLLLAIRGIKKDEELVRSADRFR